MICRALSSGVIGMEEPVYEQFGLFFEDFGEVGLRTMVEKAEHRDAPLLVQITGLGVRSDTRK